VKKRLGSCYRAVPAFILLFTVATVLVGCGGEQGPKLSVVTGEVTLDGNPLPGAGVTFHPDTAKGNTAEYLPAGIADSQGNYELITATKKGAPAGWYTVVVVAPVPPHTGGEAPKVGPPPFNIKYTDAAKSDLSVEVKDGDTAEVYDIQLTK
jgi:hypothetical protein